MHFREIASEDCVNLSAFTIFVWLNTYAKQGINHKLSNYVLNQFSSEQFQRIVQHPDKRAQVVLDNGNLVGVAIIDFSSRHLNSPNFGYEIRNLYIHPCFHRKGIGSELLRTLQHQYGDKSWLTAWVHNEPALKFYQRNDYKIIGETEFQLSDEIHMNHVLSNQYT